MMKWNSEGEEEEDQKSAMDPGRALGALSSVFRWGGGLLLPAPARPQL